MWLANSWSTACVAAALVSIGLCLSSCNKETATELWFGTYSFPKDSPEFPLYMELAIRGDEVRGRAIDGNMEEATISGTVKKGFYSLILHPIKHGSNQDQNVTYRGQRNGDTINGEWVHVVGAKGPWRASITTKTSHEAMQPYRLQCEQASMDTVTICDHGA